MGIVLFDEIQKDFGIGMVHVKTRESLVLCQVFETGLCTLSPYIALAEQGEGIAVGPAAEFLDFPVASGILLCKLVAGESQHYKAPVLVGIVQFFQSFKLGSKAALAGCIDNEKNFAFVVGQGNFLAFSIHCFEIVYVHINLPGSHALKAAAPPADSISK